MLPCNGLPGPSSSAASGSSSSGEAPSVLNLYDARVGTEFLNAFEQCAQSSSTANIPVDVSMLRGMDYVPYATPAFAERIPIQQQQNQVDPSSLCYIPINTQLGLANPAPYSQAVRYPMPDQMHWPAMTPPTMASNATYAHFSPHSAQGPWSNTYGNSVPQNPQGPPNQPYASFGPPNPHGPSSDLYSGRIAELLEHELPASSAAALPDAPSSARGNVPTLAEALQSSSSSAHAARPTIRHDGFGYSFLSVESDSRTCLWRCEFHKRRCLGTLEEDIPTKTYTLTRKHNHPPVAGGGSSDTTPQLSRCPSVVEAEAALQSPTAFNALKESEDELPTDLSRQTPPSTSLRGPPLSVAPERSIPPARSALPALNLEHYRDDTCLARIWQRNESLFGDSATFHVYWPEYAGIEHVFRTRRDRFFELKDDLESNVPAIRPSVEERKAELACARIEFEKSIHRLIRFLVLARSVPQDLRRCLEVGMGFNSIFRQLRLPSEQVQDPLRNDLYDWNEDPRGQAKRADLYDKALKAENIVLFRCLFDGCQFTTEFSDKRTKKSVNATLRTHYYKHVPKIETSQSPAFVNDQLLATVRENNSSVSTPTNDGTSHQECPESAVASIYKYETTFPSDQPGTKPNDASTQQDETSSSAHPLDQDEVHDDAVEMVTIEINNSFVSSEPDAHPLSPTLQEFLNFVEPPSTQELLEKGLVETLEETAGSSDCPGSMATSCASGDIEPATEIEPVNSNARIEAEPSESQQINVRPTEALVPEASSPAPEDNSPPQARPASNGKAKVLSPSKMIIRMRPLRTEDVPSENRAATSGPCGTGTSEQADTIVRNEDSAIQNRSGDASMEDTPAPDIPEPVSVAPSEPVGPEAAEGIGGPSSAFGKSVSLSPSNMTVRMRPVHTTDGPTRSPSSRAMLVGSDSVARATAESDDDDNACDGEAQSDGPTGSPFTIDGEEDGASKATDEAHAMQAEIEGLPEWSLEITSLDQLAPEDCLQFFEKGERRRWKCRFVDCEYSNKAHVPVIKLKQMLRKHCQEVHFSGI